MRVKVTESELCGLLGVELGRLRSVGDVELELVEDRAGESVTEADIERHHAEVFGGRPRSMSVDEARIAVLHAATFGRPLGVLSVVVSSAQYTQIREALTGAAGGGGRVGVVQEAAPIEVEVPADLLPLFSVAEAAVVRESVARLAGLARTRLAMSDERARSYAVESLRAQVESTNVRRHPRQRAARVLELLTGREAELAGQPPLAAAEAARVPGEVTVEDLERKHAEIFGRRRGAR